MDLRFLRLTTVYPTFAAQFLRAHGGLVSGSYRENYSRFTAARYAECDYHAQHLRRIGHAAENHFVSLEPLQKQWAEEHGVSFGRETWLADIAIAQVAEFQPTVLFLDDLYIMDRPFRARLQAAAGRHCRLIGWRASTTNEVASFGDLDLVLTSIRSLASQFERAGIHARVIPHGFESSVLEDVSADGIRDVDFSFAGSCGAYHPQRFEFIEALLKASPIQVWSQESSRWKDRWKRRLAAFGVRPSLETRSRTLDQEFRGRVHAQVFGLDYYRLLARSKIVLNSHISCAATDASNMRLFEATGMGACLLTDRQASLGEFFEPDVEVATYGSLEECLEKVDYLLRLAAERERIAAAGQRRTLRDHTFGGRVERLVEVLQESSRRAAA